MTGDTTMPPTGLKVVQMPERADKEIAALDAIRAAHQAQIGALKAAVDAYLAPPAWQHGDVVMLGEMAGHLAWPHVGVPMVVIETIAEPHTLHEVGFALNAPMVYRSRLDTRCALLGSDGSKICLAFDGRLLQRYAPPAKAPGIAVPPPVNIPPVGA